MDYAGVADTNRSDFHFDINNFVEQPSWVTPRDRGWD